MLREEIVKLKQLLHSHVDCNISVQLKQQDTIRYLQDQHGGGGVFWLSGDYHGGWGDVLYFVLYTFTTLLDINEGGFLSCFRSKIKKTGLKYAALTK